MKRKKIVIVFLLMILAGIILTIGWMKILPPLVVAPSCFLLLIGAFVAFFSWLSTPGEKTNPITAGLLLLSSALVITGLINVSPPTWWFMPWAKMILGILAFVSLVLFIKGFSPKKNKKVGKMAVTATLVGLMILLSGAKASAQPYAAPTDGITLEQVQDGLLLGIALAPALLGGENGTNASLLGIILGLAFVLFCATLVVGIWKFCDDNLSDPPPPPPPPPEANPIGYWEAGPPMVFVITNMYGTNPVPPVRMTNYSSSSVTQGYIPWVATSSADTNVAPACGDDTDVVTLSCRITGTNIAVTGFGVRPGGINGSSPDDQAKIAAAAAAWGVSDTTRNVVKTTPASGETGFDSRTRTLTATMADLPVRRVLIERSDLPNGPWVRFLAVDTTATTVIFNQIPVPKKAAEFWRVSLTQ